MNMKLLILTTLMISIQLLAAQSIDTSRYESGQIHRIVEQKGKTRHVITYSERGRLLSDEHYRNDRYHGKVKLYYSNGKLRLEAQYHKGKVRGEYLGYWPNGEIQKRLNYRVFRKDGLRQSLPHGEAQYYYQDGILSSEGKFRKGEKHGAWKDYDAKGKIKEKATYRKGIKQGEQTTYYPNGQVRTRYDYYEEMEREGVVLKRVIHGKQEAFYENGKLQSITMFEYGKPTGDSRNWYVDGSWSVSKMKRGGKLVTKYFNAKGEQIRYLEQREVLNEKGRPRMVKDGLEKAWANEQLILMQHYQQGKKHGITERYGPKGELKIREEYENDTLISKMQPLEAEGKMQVEHFYKGGDLRSKYITKDGKMHGPYVSYSEEGDILSKGEMVKGKKVGEWLILREGQLQEVYFKKGKEYLPSKGVD